MRHIRFQENEDMQIEVQNQPSHTTNSKQFPNTALILVTFYTTIVIPFQFNNVLNLCFVLNQVVRSLKST